MRKFLVTSFFIVVSLLSFTNVYAKKTLNDATSALNTVSQKTGIDKGDLPSVIGDTVKMLFVAVGLLFFGLMVYAGVRWMTARDKAESVDKARNTMIAAVLGLIILLASYAVTVFIQNKIIGS
ncbi:MAG: hypothetical protein AUJ23_02755 [Candidatus Magasanikbacteria bacterium CG1_02_32_51]|uniref:Uncharacterized protein n=1 Tax=Candidatus Magasanikbacteria bacterium CG1_02_32_51 TaxID=1805238 RepID=A0A1J4U6P0_9BACT|nr:MAG: hypothetical protein AUJ23_02755 [Candidatus Magasanikbacteria bacterium CG1_02_32_51]